MLNRVTKNYWPIFILLLLSPLILWPLFQQGYFFHHDDLQVMRVFEMRKCFEDFQLPCRWIPDMGYGNGYPLYNYYSALPYYIGGIFTYIFGFLGAAKVLFFIPLFLGGIFMYFLGSRLFDRWGGLASAVLYMFAPYRALDGYVRGDVAESFAISIVPLVFYFSYRFIKEKNMVTFLGTSFSFALFLLCHNILTMFFVPIILIWVLMWMYVEKLKSFYIFLSLGLGFGLAAFFIMPAFLEKDLVQVDSLKQAGFNFRANFVTVNQLFFSRFWGFGGSVFGPNDTISFQIGWPHWWLVLASFFVFLVERIYKRSGIKRLKKEEGILLVFLWGIFLVSIFMMHNKSAFIWERVGILQFAQFPWRLLTVSIFAASLLGGGLVSLLKGRYQMVLGALVVLLTVALNWSYFRPADFYPFITDNIKLSGDAWDIQQKAAILDYLPKTATEPKGPAPSSPILDSGKAEISGFENRSNRWQFKANVIQPSTIEMPVFDFLNWQVKVDGKEIDHNHDNRLGRISFTLKPGSYTVTGLLKNTSVRSLANILSLISLFILLVVPFHEKFKRI